MLKMAKITTFFCGFALLRYLLKPVAHFVVDVTEVNERDLVMKW